MLTPVMLLMSCVVLKHHYSVILAVTLSSLMSAHLLDLFYLTWARRARTRPKERHGEERAALPPSDLFLQPERLPLASRAPRAPGQSIGAQGRRTTLGAGAVPSPLACPAGGSPTCPGLGPGEAALLPLGHQLPEPSVVPTFLRVCRL